MAKAQLTKNENHILRLTKCFFGPPPLINGKSFYGRIIVKMLLFVLWNTWPRKSQLQSPAIMNAPMFYLYRKQSHMRKYIFLFLLVPGFFHFTACTDSSPEHTFNTAVLSCNTIHDFATEGLLRQLESPSVQMVDGDKDKIEQMKRKEVIDDKIQIIKDYQSKVKQIKETEDSKEMIGASRALYDYVVPVYEKEYRELARLYDEGAAKESIASYAQGIQDKYYQGFADRFDKVTAAGKTYAKEHNINVQWDVQTSPQFK